MSTPEPARKQLRHLARESIGHGIEAGEPPRVHLQDYPARLRAPRTSFVTLKLDGHLRGCIGALEATRALAEDVAANAFAAAFRDPRFPPVTRGEVDELSVQISILSPSEPLDASTEAELLARLRPGVDGLILEEGNRRGTFLPTVWQGLPEPADFLQQLKIKTGLPADYWSETIRAYRYSTEEF